MASSLTAPLEELTREARKRPILIVGGAVAILLMVTLINRRDSSSDVGADDAALDADDGGTDDTAAATGDIGYASTNPFPSGGSYFDPGTFDMETGGTVAPQTTPDGCALPMPAAPAGYVAVCAAGSWVFQRVPTQGGTTPTTPAPAKGPRIAIAKGRRFNHYALRNGKLVDGKTRTAGSAVTWKTASSATRRKTAGGSTINAVQLKSGPLSGRYVSTGIGTWHRS